MFFKADIKILMDKGDTWKAVFPSKNWGGKVKNEIVRHHNESRKDIVF